MHCVQERVREKERVSKAVRKERKKILVDHFFLPILVDKKKRNKKASVLWRTNTPRKRILVRQKALVRARTDRTALAPDEYWTRTVVVARRRTTLSLYALSFSLQSAQHQHHHHHDKKKYNPRSLFVHIVITHSGSKRKRKRARREGDEGWSKKSFRRAPSRPRRGSWSVLRSVRTA